MKKIFIYSGMCASVAMLFAAVAYANPSYFADGVSTATATSTPVFMTAGTATTTATYDAYADGTNEKADAATLGVQFTGSSTASSVKIEFEYAFNNSLANCATTPTACDWYKDALIGTNAVVSTTTQGQLGAVPNSYTFFFASTTLQGAAGISPITTRLLTVPTPTRYIRAVITIPPGSLNGAVWATFRPSRQNP